MRRVLSLAVVVAIPFVLALSLNRPCRAEPEPGSCVVHGVVTDPDGDPAPGVKMTIARREYVDERLDHDVTVAETVTLADGSYRFENLRNGNYFIYATTPRTCAVASARMRADESREREVDMRLYRSLETSGTVSNAQGEPIPRATVLVTGYTGGPPVFESLMVKTDKHGTYTFKYLWRGEHTIEARADDYAPSVLKDAAAGTAGNDFTLYIGGTVSGTVRFADTGETAPGVEVFAINNAGIEAKWTRTNEEGKYSLERLSRDIEHTITVQTEPYVAVEKRTVTLKDGQTVSGVDLEVSHGASISGTVTALDTGEPIPGMLVVLGGWPIVRWMDSGADGTYKFSALPAGKYRIDCRFAPRSGWVEPSRREVSVAHDEHIGGIDFALVRGASISGRITDEALQGISGAEVDAESDDAWNNTTSDEKGRYRVNGLKRSSWYTLTVEARGYGKVTSKPVLVPEEGEVTGIDLVMKPGATVSGYVVDTNGERVPYAEVELSTWDMPYPRPRAEADDRGGFKIRDVPPGQYDLMVELSDPRISQQAQNDPLTVGAGEDLTDVEVLVEALGAGIVEGCVRDENGNAIPGVSVNTHLGPISAYVGTDDSGHYRFEGLKDGTVDIEFYHQSYAPASLGDIPVGSRQADVVMASRGSVSGAVFDAATGKPIPDFAVAVVKFDEDENGYPDDVCWSKHFHSDEGQFLLDALRPGTVTLRASATGYAPRELADIEVRSGEVTSGIEFRLSEGQIVRGVVVAASDSSPVEGANIYLGSSSLDATIWEEFRDIAARTAADGTFVLKDLAVGGQIVEAYHPDFMSASVWVTVQEGSETQVTIRLEAGGVVGGHVRLNDTASSGARMNLEGADGLDAYADTDKDGRYEFKKVPAGHYVIHASVDVSEGPDSPWRTQHAIVKAEEGGVTVRDFAFRTGDAVIEGCVTRTGEPLDNETVSVRATYLSDLDESRQIYASVQSDGSYRLEGLAGDSYKVAFNVGSDVGDSWISRAATVQIADGDTVRVDVDFSGSATIRGTVSWPAGYIPASVSVSETAAAEVPPSENTGGNVIRTEAAAQCTPDGAFEITNLPAGSYRVSAVSIRGNRWNPTDFWHASQEVTLEEGQAATADFSVEAGEVNRSDRNSAPDQR